MSDDKSLSERELLGKVDPDPELVSLREQLSEALSDVKRLKTQVGDDVRLFEAVRSNVEILEPYPRVSIPKPTLKHAPVEAALILCDAHSEELVLAEEIEGLASYDWETFEQRMASVPEKAVELVNIMRQGSPIKKLHVWMLGDWFVGQILPDELGWGSSMPLPAALPRASMVVADALMRLASHFEEVEVVGIAGNHGRNTTRPVTKMTADRNWDYSLYLIAQAMTADEERIHWTLPKSRVKVVDVMGWKNALTHGDICRRTHTIPYFGIINAIRKQHDTRRRTTEDFDYAWMGHWHHWGLLEGEVIICPPLIGHSQFSQYAVHERAPAQQLLAFFSEKHALMSMWPINL